MYDQSIPTLEDAKAALLSRTDLKRTKQRDLVSAITRIGEAIETPLFDIPADAPSLLGRVAGLHHKQMGISAKTLGNLKSSFKAALQAAGVLPPDDEKVALSEAWQTFHDQCEQKHQQYSLARFMRFCTIREVPPDKVNNDTLKAFKAYLDERDVGKDPKKLCKEIAQTWNGLSDRLELGFATLAYEKAKRFTTRPMAEYPQTLQDDIDAYFKRQQVNDIFDDSGPDKPLKAISVRNIKQHLQRYLHALTDTGLAIDTMVDLKAVVTAENMKRAFRQIMVDMDVGPEDKVPPTLHKIGASLKAIAKYHLLLEPNMLTEIDTVRKKVAHNPKGMSAKNQLRLGQFDDWRNVLLVVGLPKTLLKRAEQSEGTRTGALDAMYAALIAILLSAPMRIKNAASLRLDEHVIPHRRGKKFRYIIRVPDHEVKNRQHIEVELNETNSAILKTYIETYRPLISDKPGKALFPRQSDGQARTPSNLSQTLSEKIKRETGLDFHAHLFRHFAGFLFLKQNPGEYETVRRLLGHAKLQTTLDFYAHMTSKAAHDRFDEVVLQKFRGTAR